jgi:hypothetical protein
MAGLDPAIFFHTADARIKFGTRMTCPSIVIPAKAGIQLHFTNHVMAGLDPAISGQRQIRGSSPRMTYYKNRHGRS